MKPRRPEPMLARDAKTLPSGGGWAYEIKWDGVRALARVGEEPKLWSRRGENLSPRYPELIEADSMPVMPEVPDVSGSAEPSAVLDGEIVAFDDEGRPSFQTLQRRMGLSNPLTIARRVGETPVSFVAFDLLELNGKPTVELPYERRRALLDELTVDGERWRIPRHHLGDGEALLEAARRQGLEGVVAKRSESAYRGGSRSGDWVKVRLKRRQDFVIGGWLRGDGGRSSRLGSLQLGVWDAVPGEAAERGEPQRLVFAGGVGSGLSQRTIDDLEERLAPLRTERNPFELGVGPKRKDVVLCEPRLVCSVEFSEWTYEDTLRQPAFKGLRDDIDPREVVREG